MVFSTPKELRNLFVIQTIQGFPTEAIFNDATKRIAMQRLYYKKWARKQFAYGMERILNRLGRTLSSRK